MNIDFSISIVGNHDDSELLVTHAEGGVSEPVAKIVIADMPWRDQVFTQSLCNALSQVFADQIKAYQAERFLNNPIGKYAKASAVVTAEIIKKMTGGQ